MDSVSMVCGRGVCVSRNLIVEFVVDGWGDGGKMEPPPLCKLKQSGITLTTSHTRY